MNRDQAPNTVPVLVPAATFPDPAEVILAEVVAWRDTGLAIADTGGPGSDSETIRQIRHLHLAEPGLPANRAAQALEAAGLIATTEPMLLRTFAHGQDGEILNTLVGGFTELLRRLGYAGTVVAEESPFGGWNLMMAARRMTPAELSDRAGTVRG